MKKTSIQVLTISILAFLVALICGYFVLVWIIGISQANKQETFLLSSQSPGGEYQVEAYRTEPGATVDFSVKAYLINGDQKEVIYNAYHESEAEITWIDNSTVSINGKTLNLASGETYDWKKQ